MSRHAGAKWLTGQEQENQKSAGIQPHLPPKTVENIANTTHTSPHTPPLRNETRLNTIYLPFSVNFTPLPTQTYSLQGAESLADATF